MRYAVMFERLDVSMPHLSSGSWRARAACTWSWHMRSLGVVEDMDGLGGGGEGGGGGSLRKGDGEEDWQCLNKTLGRRHPPNKERECGERWQYCLWSTAFAALWLQQLGAGCAFLKQKCLSKLGSLPLLRSGSFLNQWVCPKELHADHNKAMES